MILIDWLHKYNQKIHDFLYTAMETLYLSMIPLRQLVLVVWWPVKIVMEVIQGNLASDSMTPSWKSVSYTSHLHRIMSVHAIEFKVLQILQVLEGAQQLHKLQLYMRWRLLWSVSLSSYLTNQLRQLNHPLPTVFDTQSFRADSQLSQPFIYILEVLIGNFQKSVYVLILALPAKLSEIQKCVVNQSSDFVLLTDQILSEMVEVTILKIHIFFEFWNYIGNVLALKIVVIFVDQLRYQSHLTLVEDYIIKNKVVNRFVDLCKQILHSFTCCFEIIVYHFLKVGLLFVVRAQIHGDCVLHLLQCNDCMNSIIFLVLAKASFDLADGRYVGAGQAAAELNNSLPVTGAYIGLIFPHHIGFHLLIYRFESMSLISQEVREPKRLANYLLGDAIGQGTFNKVKIAKHIPTNEQVAIKIIEKSKFEDEADHRRLDKELKILRKVRHPNIIQLLEILEDKEHVYLVMEHAMRGQLFEHISTQEKLTEFEASKFLQQLLDATEYMHQLGIAHRDLKPENLLLDYKYNIKVIDFGLSNIYVKGELLKTACGSPCYAAPEMLQSLPYEGVKVDTWSIGIILYAMCFGYLPFDQPTPEAIYAKIIEGKYEIPQHASESLVAILSIMLEINPKKRATIQEIRSHPFCKFSPIGYIPGIIIGLSDVPYEIIIEEQMKEMNLDVSSLRSHVKANKHNTLTATYYLILQRNLRRINQTSISYYTDKNNLINRYALIEKVKKNYERRLELRKSLNSMRASRKGGHKSEKNKTTEKKRVFSQVKSAVKTRLFTPEKPQKSKKKLQRKPLMKTNRKKAN